MIAQLQTYGHVRREIAKQGRKLAWVALRLGVSQGHLSRMLDGQRPLTAAYAEQLATILGLPLEYVLHGPAKPAEPQRSEVPA